MKCKILVIDDEIVICQLLERFLAGRGYEVVSSTSATEGIEKVKRERPKVVLLDIKMPGMDGVKAAKEIKKIDEKVGIIMATAVMDEKIAQQTIEVGAVGYIIKPFDLDYLEKSLLPKIELLP